MLNKALTSMALTMGYVFSKFKLQKVVECAAHFASEEHSQEWLNSHIGYHQNPDGGMVVIMFGVVIVIGAGSWLHNRITGWRK